MPELNQLVRATGVRLASWAAVICGSEREVVAAVTANATTSAGLRIVLGCSLLRFIGCLSWFRFLFSRSRVLRALEPLASPGMGFESSQRKDSGREHCARFRLYVKEPARI